MIFPQDVHKLIQDKSRIAGDNKVQLVIVIFVLGNLFGFFLLSFLLSFVIPENSVKAAITIQIIILIIVGIFVFRFVIFDENSKKREYQGQQSDSFTRYMYIRKDNITEIQDEVYAFEYADGSALFATEFRFGSNDDSKAAGTRKFYEDVMKLVAQYGFEVRWIVGSEDFRTSKELQHHLDLINAIDDVSMRNTMLTMTNKVLDVSLKLSNVDCVYMLVRSVYNYQKSDLEMLLRTFNKIIADSYTAFRDIRFLDFSAVLELYRYFYGIAAIDLAMMKSISLASDISDDFSSVIQVLSMHGESGKTYTNKSSDDLVKISEKSLN